jgi:hypothetical protein
VKAPQLAAKELEVLGRPRLPDPSHLEREVTTPITGGLEENADVGRRSLGTSEAVRDSKYRVDGVLIRNAGRGNVWTAPERLHRALLNRRAGHGARNPDEAERVASTYGEHCRSESAETCCSL